MIEPDMEFSEETPIEDKRGKRGRPKGQATQVVYSALRGEILTLALKPGQYLEELVLEKRFGVSRTPIREALIRLQTDRLVKFSPNRGHYVESVSFQDVPRIFEALDLQQAAVLQLAAKRRSPRHIQDLRKINDEYRRAGERNDHKAMAELNHDFHLLIAKAAGNSFLSEFYETMLNFSIRLSYLMFQTASRNKEDFEAYYMRVFSEHNEMIDLIEKGEGERLHELSRRHVRLFSDRTVRFLTERADLDAFVETFAGP
jgi:DNA-binding GntR family transcriptional regulator